MALFKRGNKDGKKKTDGATGATDATDATGVNDAVADAGQGAGEGSAESVPESSPQRVGIVSGVLSTAGDSDGESPFGDVVARHFGPDQEVASDQESSRATPDRPGSQSREAEGSGEESTVESAAEATPDDSTAAGRGYLHAVESLFSDNPAAPELEVDPMAHIGRATTITGDIVAEEDLEIQGTIEGSVRLGNHQVTVGAEGHVKASVDAHTVLVYGKITGDVVASELVEVHPGGIIGGDVKAPRVIMRDGAIVVGGLDMSAALPNANAAAPSSSDLPPFPEDLERPRLIKVDLPSEALADHESV